MVENDRLETTRGGDGLLAQQCEHFPDSLDVLIAELRIEIILALARSRPFGKVNLARLIVNQQSRYRMMHLRQKELLQRQRRCYMVREPVRAAANLP